MIKILKAAIYSCATLLARIISDLTTWGPIGQLVSDQTQTRARSQTLTISHGGIPIVLSVPTTLTRWRASTFSTKEPETLEWIDSFNDRDVLWDIGANVGLYSVYAVAKKSCSVVAVEPSVFNLELLARNIVLNSVENSVTILPIAVDETNSKSQFILSSTELGGALSTFRQNYSYDGKPLPLIFNYQTLGITIEQAIKLWNLEPPDHLKIDVDGIEHLVLAGVGNLLHEIKSVLVEINKSFVVQATRVSVMLEGAGLSLSSEHRIIATRLEGMMFNQIWRRPRG